MQQGSSASIFQSLLRACSPLREEVRSHVDATAATPGSYPTYRGKLGIQIAPPQIRNAKAAKLFFRSKPSS
eukprot:1555973-Rhodomonas_salina.2